MESRRALLRRLIALYSVLLIVQGICLYIDANEVTVFGATLTLVATIAVLYKAWISG